MFDNGRIRDDVKSAEAATNEQQALLQEAERAALLEVDAAYRDRESARIIAASFEGTGEGTGRLAKSKELLDMAQIGYTRGGSGYLEVIDALSAYRSEQTEYLRALAAYRTAIRPTGTRYSEARNEDSSGQWSVVSGQRGHISGAKLSGQRTTGLSGVPPIGSCRTGIGAPDRPVVHDRENDRVARESFSFLFLVLFLTRAVRRRPPRQMRRKRKRSRPLRWRWR